MSKKSAGTKLLPIILLSILVGFLLMQVSCGGSSTSSSGAADTTKTATLELGETKTAVSSLAGSSGAVIGVNDPDSPINGLSITVPSGAYSSPINFDVSYNEISSHSGIAGLDPVTPLITVKNGGKYSDEILTVKIPVTVEDDYHYMAFYYDDVTGKLEGIPEVTHDGSSLTIATRHFSSVFVNRIGINLILGDFDSGYQVTKDNWPFDNPGTYLSPGGICSGMSTASLYYYDEKKKKGGQPQLNGRYDQGVSGWGLDDEQAIKLCSVIQWWEGNSQGDMISRWHDLAESKSPAWTYLMFAHSIFLTGRPQYVAVYPEGDKVGHALVVYKKTGNNLFVADPNLPKDQSVKLEFAWDDEGSILNGAFKPFEARWNSGSDKIEFTKVHYIGKTALIDEDFGELWDKLDKGTLGDRFPSYDLMIIDKNNSGLETEYSLADAYTTNNSTVKIKIDAHFEARLVGYYAASTINENESDIIEVALLPGENKIGLNVQAEMDSDVSNDKEWVWTDFKYVTITREASEEPENPVLDCGCPQKYDASLDASGDSVASGYWVDDTKCIYEMSLNPFYLSAAYPYVNGELHGLVTKFYTSGVAAGEIKSTTPYEEGVKNGNYMFYNTSGTVTSCTIYEDGHDRGSCL